MRTAELQTLSDVALRWRIVLCCATAMDRTGKARGDEWAADTDAAIAEWQRRGLARSAAEILAQ